MILAVLLTSCRSYPWRLSLLLFPLLHLGGEYASPRLVRRIWGRVRATTSCGTQQPFPGRCLLKARSWAPRKLAWWVPERLLHLSMAFLTGHPLPGRRCRGMLACMPGLRGQARHGFLQWWSRFGKSRGTCTLLIFFME